MRTFLNRIKKYIPAICAFLIPLLIGIFFAVPAIGKGSGISFALDSEVQVAGRIREFIISGDSLKRVEALRIILSGYMDPIFLLSLFGKTLDKLLLAGYFIRCSLASLFMFIFLSRKMYLKENLAVLFSLIYVYLPVNILYMGLVSYADMVIMLPVALFFLIGYIDDDSLINSVKLAVAAAFLSASGIYGFMAGIPFVFIFAIYMLICRTKDFKSFITKFGGIVLTWIMSMFISAAVFVPRQLFTPSISFDAIGVEDNVRYSFFDLLVSLIDGRAITGTEYSDGFVTAPSMAMTALILLLLILFFINRAIPPRVKFATLIISILFHIRLSVGFINVFMNYYDCNVIRAACVFTFSVFFLTVAVISLHNIPSLTEGNIAFGAFVGIALLILSNSSGVDVTPGVYPLYFTAVSMIIVTGSIIYSVRQGGSNFILTVIVTLAAFLINLYILLPKVEMFSDAYRTFNYKLENSDVSEIDDGIGLLLYGEGSENCYKVIHFVSDKDDIGNLSPKQLNLLSQKPLFINEMANLMYQNGFSEDGGDMFTVTDPGKQCEIIIYADGAESVEYYAYSSFASRAYLTDCIAGEGEVQVSESGFLSRVVSDGGLVNVRLALVNPGPESGSFAIYRLNRDVVEEINGDTLAFNGKNIFACDIPSGKATIVTSVDYNSELEVTGKDVTRVYEFGGKLAFDVENSNAGERSYQIKSYDDDIIFGTVMSVCSVVLIILMVYINKVKLAKREETVPDGQADNRRNKINCI